MAVACLPTPPLASLYCPDWWWRMQMGTPEDPVASVMGMVVVQALELVAMLVLVAVLVQLLESGWSWTGPGLLVPGTHSQALTHGSAPTGPRRGTWKPHFLRALCLWTHTVSPVPRPMPLGTAGERRG